MRCTLLLSLAGLATVVVSAARARAGDALEEQVARLEEQVHALESKRRALLDAEVERFLAANPASVSAQGAADWRERTTLQSRFTTVFQATVDYCDENRALVDGDVDLDFGFQVSDRLRLFANLTANTNSGFEPLGDGVFTASGLTDGIGVNGALPTDPGSVTVYEAGIAHVCRVGNTDLHVELGSLDPRRRFGQNAYADDENTQFLNNLFDDVPSVLWLKDNTGRTVLGWHVWFAVGESKALTLSAGWFNVPGQFFNNGQLFVQAHWSGEVGGRAMNVRLFGWLDEFFEDAAGDGSAGGGVSWDWRYSDRVGFFVRIAGTGSDVNPVEFDAQLGAALFGLVKSRPDDVIGIGVGFISLQDGTSFGTFPEDVEFHLEIYYRAMLEGGKLQVTPHLMYVSDPGGGNGVMTALWILGVRIFVPF